MRILITGGAGFIGYHLAQSCKRRGDEVVSLDNGFHPCLAPSDTKYADIRYYDEIEKYVEWADTVFHLAAQIHVDRSIHYPQETLDINVKGTLNILEACRKFGKKMVFASTSEVYGSSQVEFMNESHPLDGQSPYAASKIAGDRLCKAYYDTYGTDVTILRNFNTFGEWQKDDSYGSVIAKFTRAALTGEPLYIYGDGTQERDYMHVKDAVGGYHLCESLNKPGEIVNIGTGKTITINELAERIVSLTQSKSPIIHIAPRAGEVQRLCAGIEKARSLGFEPKTDFDKDLANYSLWFKENMLPRA